jgi:hypothetical protein
MRESLYRNRRAVQIENDSLRVTVLVEGGHIAEIFHKQERMNPLWTPPWPSIEPSTYGLSRHPEYGADAESKLLSGLMGHNLCLDIFGGPSPEEAAAGMTVHGEASLNPYTIGKDDSTLVSRTVLETAQLRVERRVLLAPGTTVVSFKETVENLSPLDRPIAWTQHVTLGPPFLERGITQFRASATRSKVIESDFTGGKGVQRIGAEFDWPYCPHKDGGSIDLRTYTDAAVSGGFSTHLMDPSREQAFFLAYSPRTSVLLGYVWKRFDFPWLGRWEENHLRTEPPWSGKTLTCGLEFGVSPMPESRREMITRGSLFGVPAFRWIPARSQVQVDYCAFLSVAPSIPEGVVWDGAHGIRF